MKADLTTSSPLTRVVMFLLVVPTCSITHHINWEQNTHKLRSLSNWPAARTGMISAPSHPRHVQYRLDCCLQLQLGIGIVHWYISVNTWSKYRLSSNLDLFPKQHIYEKIIYKESSPRHIGLDRWDSETIQIPVMRWEPWEPLSAVFVLIRSNDWPAIFLLQNFRPGLNWVWG